MGDVIAHAILPGIAASFILYGMLVPAMSIGGLAAGLTVAILAGVVSRVTALREDASLAAFCLIAVATGLMLVPAIAAQFWTQNLRVMLVIAVIIGMAGAVLGLMLAFAHHLPSGPAIILVVGAIYILSLLFGRFGSVRAKYFPFRHLEH